MSLSIHNSAPSLLPRLVTNTVLRPSAVGLSAHTKMRLEKQLFLKLMDCRLLDRDGKLIFDPTDLPHPLSRSSKHRLREILTLPLVVYNKESKLLLKMPQVEFLTGMTTFFHEKLPMRFSSFLKGEAASYVIDMPSYLEQLIHDFLKFKGLPQDMFAEELALLKLKGENKTLPTRIEWLDLMHEPPTQEQLTALRRCCLQYFETQSKGEISQYLMEKEGFLQFLIPRERPLYPKPEPALFYAVGKGNPSSLEPVTSRISGHISHIATFRKDALLISMDPSKNLSLEQPNFWQIVVDNVLCVDRLEKHHESDFSAALQAVQTSGYLIENGVSVRSIISKFTQDVETITKAIQEKVTKNQSNLLGFLFNITFNFYLEEKTKPTVAAIWKKCVDIAQAVDWPKDSLSAKLAKLFNLPFEELARGLYQFAQLMALFKHEKMWVENEAVLTLHIDQFSFLFPSEISLENAPYIVRELVPLSELMPVATLNPLLRTHLEKLRSNPMYEADRELLDSWLAPWKIKVSEPTKIEIPPPVGLARLDLANVEVSEVFAELLEKKDPIKEWQLFWAHPRVVLVPPSLVPFEDRLNGAKTLEELNFFATLLTDTNFEECLVEGRLKLYLKLIELTSQHLNNPKASLKEPLLLRIVDRILKLKLYACDKVFLDKFLEFLKAIWSTSKGFNNRMQQVLKTAQSHLITHIDGAQLVHLLHILALYQVAEISEEPLRMRCLRAFESTMMALNDARNLYRSLADSHFPNNLDHFKLAIELCKRDLATLGEDAFLLNSIGRLWAACPKDQQLESIKDLLNHCAVSALPNLLEWALKIPGVDRAAVAKTFLQRFGEEVSSWDCDLHISCAEQLAKDPLVYPQVHILLSSAIRRSDAGSELGRLFVLLRKTAFASYEELSIFFRGAEKCKGSLLLQPLIILESLNSLQSMRDPFYRTTWKIALEMVKSAHNCHLPILRILENSHLVQTIYAEEYQAKGRELYEKALESISKGSKKVEEVNKLLNVRDQFTDSFLWNVIDCGLIKLLCNSELNSLLNRGFGLVQALLGKPSKKSEGDQIKSACTQFVKSLAIQAKVDPQMEPEKLKEFYDDLCELIPDEPALLDAIIVLNRPELLSTGFYIILELLEGGISVDVRAAEILIQRLLEYRDPTLFNSMEKLITHPKLIEMLSMEVLVRLNQRYIMFRLEEESFLNETALVTALEHLIVILRFLKQSRKLQQTLWDQAIHVLARLHVKHRNPEAFSSYFQILLSLYLDNLASAQPLVVVSPSHPALKDRDVPRNSVECDELVVLRSDHPVVKSLGISLPKKKSEHIKTLAYLLSLTKAIFSLQKEEASSAPLDIYLDMLCTFFMKRVEDKTICEYISLIDFILWSYLQFLPDSETAFASYLTHFLSALYNSKLLPLEKRIEYELISTCRISDELTKLLKGGNNEIKIHVSDAATFKSFLAKIIDIQTQATLIRAISALNNLQSLYYFGFPQEKRSCYRMFFKAISNFPFTQNLSPALPTELLMRCIKSSRGVGVEMRGLLFTEFYQIALQLVPYDTKKMVDVLLGSLLRAYKEELFFYKDYLLSIIKLFNFAVKIPFDATREIKETDAIFKYLFLVESSDAEKQASALKTWIDKLIEADCTEHAKRLLLEIGHSLSDSKQVIDALKEAKLL